MVRAIFAALFTFTVCAFAQGNTAIAALRQLPNDARKNLARIEGRDGAPWPERWYFLVRDADQPLGLREYVVADGELKANRTISQFADEIKTGDVIGSSVVKFDSDAVAALSARFCVANGARLGSINYELGKYGADSAAAWRATVLNEKGDPLGVLIISASEGNVERHDGFDNKPVEVADIEEPKTPAAAPKVPAVSPEIQKPKTPKVAAKPEEKPVQKPATPSTTSAKPQTAVAATKSDAGKPSAAKPATTAATKKPSSPEALLQKPFLTTKPAATPKIATPEKPKPPVVVATPTPKPNALKRFGNSVGGGVKKLFGN